MEEAMEKIQHLEEHSCCLGDTVGRLSLEADRVKAKVQGVTVERDPVCFFFLTPSAPYLMHKSTKKLATQLQTKRAQTAKLTNALHERDACLTTLSCDHHRALASAEIYLGQREAEAAWAQSVEMHTKWDERERQDTETALHA
jgi:hypothetical protein